MRIVKNTEKSRNVSNGKIVEKIYAKEGSVIEIEYSPKHVPTIIMYCGV